MGRTPDYKASFMASLGANPEFYAPFGGNARNWYQKYARKALFLNHVLINPPVDRNKPVHEVADVFLHVVGERDDGMVVSAARRCWRPARRSRTRRSSRRTAPSTLEEGKAEDYALVFIAPMDTPGAKLLCRAVVRATRAVPFDHPLSSRFDENDAVLVFDNAFIPWENVLVYRDVERANAFYAAVRVLQPLQPPIGHAPGRETRLHDRAVRARRSRPTAPTGSAACRPRSAS